MSRILTVDDEQSILNMMKVLLESQGYDVVAIQDSGKAAEFVKSDEQLDAMISDIRMKPLNGMQLLKIAKEARPDLPVIMVTAFHSQETLERAKSLGAADYLRKPFRTEQLFGTVAKAIEDSKKDGEE